jgi:hypothetical protein
LSLSWATSTQSIASHPISLTFILILSTHLRGAGIVGIAASYGLDDRGVRVRVPVGSRIFSFPNHPDRLWGPPTLSTGVKRPGREVDHSHSTSAEVKKM